MSARQAADATANSAGNRARDAERTNNQSDGETGIYIKLQKSLDGKGVIISFKALVGEVT